MIFNVLVGEASIAVADPTPERPRRSVPQATGAEGAWRGYQFNRYRVQLDSFKKALSKTWSHIAKSSSRSGRGGACPKLLGRKGHGGATSRRAILGNSGLDFPKNPRAYNTSWK